MKKNFTQISSSPTGRSQVFNRYAYLFFILVGVCLFLFTKNWMMAVSNLGMALIFDPFNPQISWHNRPKYQRIWLFVHVAAVLILLGIGFFIKHS